MGVVAGIAVFIISIGVLLSLTAILWRYHLREKNKCKKISILNVIQNSTD